MPIIKDFDIHNISPTNEEISVFSNCGVHYVFSRAEDMTIVDIYKSTDYAEDDFIGSLSVFMSDDIIPIIDLSFVVEKHRRRGHMYNLYCFMVDLYGGLISDIQVTPEANELWMKMSKTYTVKEEVISDDGTPAPTRYVIQEN